MYVAKTLDEACENGLQRVEGGGGGVQGGHSGTLYSGLHTWFPMFLKQVGEQVGGCCGGGGTHGGHSGTSHWGLHTLFLMLLRQVEEHVGGGGGVVLGGGG